MRIEGRISVDSAARGPGVRRLVALACIVGALAGSAPSVRGAETDVARQAMAEAMARMMEAMGLFGSGAGAMPAMPGSMGMPGMPSPGGGAAEDYGRMGKEWMEKFSGALPQLKGMMPASLEGVWEAAGGGLLIVQGEGFRLYAPNWAFVDGRLRISGDRLRLTGAQAGFDLEVEYAQDQGRLVLRDASGQIYLYRLLVLDGGG